MHSFVHFIDEGWLSKLFGRKKEEVPKEPAKWTTAMSAKVKKPFTPITPPPSNEPQLYSVEHFLKWHEDKDPNLGNRVVKTVRMMRKDAGKGIGMLGEFTIEYRNKFGLYQGNQKGDKMLEFWHAIIAKHGDATAKKASAKYYAEKKKRK